MSRLWGVEADCWSLRVNHKVEKYLDLIARKFANEINADEQQELQDWLDESEENELLYHRMHEAWNRDKYRPIVENQESVYETISSRLGLNEQSDGWGKPMKKGGAHWLRIAAVFVLGIGIAGMGWYLNPFHETAREVHVRELVVKSNPKGRRSSITLPDGTKVELNSESYIEYDQNFTQGREVRLVGEAFFEVVPDKLHPFVVTSGDVRVRVLGTSFNVRAFPFDQSMSVAVVTGKVWVGKKDTLLDSQRGVLLPKEMARIDHKTGAFEKSGYQADEILAWKDGILAFNKASFGDIVQRLERWYGVNFVVRRAQPITDGFTGHYKNPSLKLVLEGMSFSSEFKFIIEGDTVIIY